LGVAADAIQAVFGNHGDVIDVVATEIGRLAGFQVAPDLLSWIDDRRTCHAAIPAVKLRPLVGAVAPLCAEMRSESFHSANDKGLV
jgi:hypothetical protein